LLLKMTTYRGRKWGGRRCFLVQIPRDKWHRTRCWGSEAFQVTILLGSFASGLGPRPFSLVQPGTSWSNFCSLAYTSVELMWDRNHNSIGCYQGQGQGIQCLGLTQLHSITRKMTSAIRIHTITTMMETFSRKSNVSSIPPEPVEFLEGKVALSISCYPWSDCDLGLRLLTFYLGVEIQDGKSDPRIQRVTESYSLQNICVPFWIQGIILFVPLVACSD
jgi:hypothetical protein